MEDLFDAGTPFVPEPAHDVRDIAESNKIRSSWKTERINGVPTRVKFTISEMRKWTVRRDHADRIIGVEETKKSKRDPLEKFSTQQLVAELTRRVKETTCP